MRTARDLIFFLLTCLVIPIFPSSAAAPDIIISEVQIGGVDGNDEFVEFYNPHSVDTSLSGWKLCRKTSAGSFSQIKTFSGGDTVPSKGFFLFANGNGIFAKTYGLDDASTTSSPLASNNSIALADSCSATAPPTIILDSLAWGTGKPFDATTPTVENPPAGKSIVRDLETLGWRLSDTPTPTNRKGETLPKENPNPLPAPDPPDTSIDTSTDASIRLNELLPNPKGADAEGEWVELYNFGEETILLDGWSIADAAGGAYPLEAGSALESGAFLVVKTGSKFSMNNTKGETITLFDATKTAIGKVSYETAKEGQSFDYSPSGWRWSKEVTPGKANILNNPPERKKTEIPKTAYRDVYADFSAKGSDEDGDTLKYVWDFGDGHKSYLRETRHKYTETGSFHGTLTISDGTETDVKGFTIKVEKFPDRKIRIIALSANPKGADTGVEWLLLKNEDKKKIDLLGWSIATGTKKKTLANHPVNESFILKPGEERRLMNPTALFTLPNERGYIELRRPDGKASQTVKYRKDGGVDDDERYSKKEGGGWEWTHQKKQEVADDERATETNGLEKNPASTIPDETGQAETFSEVAISGMSVIEEYRKEKRLAEIIRQESHIDTPVKFLSAPSRVLGATIEFEQTEPADAVRQESFFEKINELANAIVREP